jgi:spore coat protein U-like protein
VKYTHVLSTTVAAAVLSLALVSTPAFATNATTTIAVSTTVTNSCVLTAGTLTFAAYTGVVDDSTGTFTVNCTNNGDYTIALNAGIGTGTSFATRYMMNGTYKLGYNIYTSTAYTTVWGDGSGTTSTVPGVGTGTAQTISVYGQIPAGEAAISGSYTDTITATVTY